VLRLLWRQSNVLWVIYVSTVAEQPIRHIQIEVADVVIHAEEE